MPILYPRIRVRRSKSTAKWYVVIQRTKHKSECIEMSMTFKAAATLADQLKHAFWIATRPTDPVKLAIEPVKQWSQWRHYNGIEYVVLYIANMHSTMPQYPPTVIYFNKNDESKIWTRPLHDWHRSMRPA